MNETASIMHDQETISPEHITNPFPGLRPFSFEESHLFFGREGQSDEVLEKLAVNRFAAILGASGSGKSSLVFCGLMPILYGGFLATAGSRWRIVTARPGNAPIDNLASALTEKLPGYQELSEEERKVRKMINNTTLKSTSLGLVDCLRQAKLGKNENIFILIDQFEELFRYRKSSSSDHAVEESIAFVKLLLEAVNQKEIPVYIALTMRSDFIGDCAQYPDLTKKINDSHYLIPQMTREQKRLAIVGPVAVGGGKVTSRLVQRLLNDVGDNPDQLPILQHALMRTWDYYRNNPDEGELLDVGHYEAIGTMAEALSQHANEAYDDLSEKDKLICESIFRTLTEKSADNLGIRRPTKLKDIAAIAKVSSEEIIPIIEKFRAPGISLLVPPYGKPLTPDTVIDISHESLMRIWVRLKKWVDQEYESVQMYLRLCEASAMYQQGKAGLWRPPDLQLALNWKESAQPTLTWGKQYNPAYERAMVFLETSKRAFDEELANKEKQQKKRLRQARITATVLGTAAVISIIFLVVAIYQRTEAEKNRLIAEANEKEAIKQRQEALQQRAEAEKQKSIAELQREEAEHQKLIAIQNEEEAKRQELLANRNAEEARKQRDRANEQTVEALNQKKRAEQQKSIAETEKDRADKLRMLSIAKSMAVKSLQQTDKDRKALLAQQAYIFHSENDGIYHDHDIYDALYYALKNVNHENYNSLTGHEKSVRSSSFSATGERLFTAGSEGKIFMWDMKSAAHAEFANAGYVIRSLAISPEGNLMAISGESSAIKVYRTSDVLTDPAVLKGHTGQVWHVIFKDNNTLISWGTDKKVLVWDLKTGNKDSLLTTTELVKALKISADKKHLIAGSEKGNLVLINLSSGTQKTIYSVSGQKSVNAVAIHPNGNLIAFGDESGVTRMFSLSEMKVIHTFTGHSSRVNDVEFNKTGKLLATASFDGSVRLYNLERINEQPIILKDHSSWVWTISFDPSEDRIIAGCVDNLIRVWPTDPHTMANQLCGKVERNLSQREWEQFVAKDIAYRNTCNNLNAGNEGNQE